MEPSPLVKQILGVSHKQPTNQTTPIATLPSEVRTVVDDLPDLSYMQARVLMFPIIGDQN